MISVCMTTYNGEKYLKEQVDSILNQTYQDFELIILDDCSKDNTFKILQEYEKKDSRIKIFQNKTNLGFKKNFEKAVSFCTGEYIAFSDQDDIWENFHLELLLQNIKQNDLACSDSLLVDENNNSMNIFMKDALPFKGLVLDSKQFLPFFLMGENFVQGSTCLLNAEFLKKNLPIPDFVEFHDFWFALNACISNGIAYINQSTIRYRQHSSNVTMNTNNPVKKIFYAIKKRETIQKNERNNILLCDYCLEQNLNEKDKKIVSDIKIFLKNKTNKKFFRWTFYFIKNYKLLFNEAHFDKRFFVRFGRRLFI